MKRDGADEHAVKGKTFWIAAPLHAADDGAVE